jgi:IclR family transcriptional regulator, KDG regulon repressor
LSEQRDSNSSVDRTLSILEFIANEDKGVNLTSISTELNIPKTTVFRLIERLTARGYVDYDDQSEKYFLGIESILLSMKALLNMNVVEVSIPYLKELSHATKETSFLGVYNEGEIVYLYKSEGTQSISITSQLGSRRPVHCTGLGKAILSGYPIEQVTKILEEKGMNRMTDNTITTPEGYLQALNEVRINGYTMDNEELEDGLGCYAAPVYNYLGKVVAAICVSGPIERVVENKNILVNELTEAANQISKRLGFVPTMLQR